LGTDDQGRDILSALMPARISLWWGGLGRVSVLSVSGWAAVGLAKARSSFIMRGCDDRSRRS
jgi:ABC-type dipeptide/oligopeptide/nickel transport system permease subunit